MLGEPADFAFGHAQHLRHVREGAPALERREPADHRAMLALVFAKDQIHHVVFAVVGEIHINVGQFVQRHALLIQEAPEVEAKADGAYIGDAEAIAHERIRRAAAGDPLDAMRAALLKDVPHHEKVFFVADGGNDAQFLFNLRAHGSRPLAAPSTTPAIRQTRVGGGTRAALNRPAARTWGIAVCRTVYRNCSGRRLPASSPAIQDAPGTPRPFPAACGSGGVRPFVSLGVVPATRSTCGWIAGCHISYGRPAARNESPDRRPPESDARPLASSPSGRTGRETGRRCKRARIA